VNAILTIMRKELRDATRSRWLLAYAGAFALIALAFGVVQEQGDVGTQGFNRTTASIINLCILLVPLLALVIGAGSIAGERDRGTLTTLLAQPLSPVELLIGKYLGLTIAVWMAVALGFGAAGLLLALVSPVTDFAHYLLFIVLSGALASAMLSIGVLISVLSDGRAKALAIAVLAWFGFVLFYDLAAIGVALTITSSGESLVLAAIGNPVESVRILAILSLEPDLHVLGPLGAYLHTEMGTLGSAVLLSLAVLAWAAAPLAAATLVFSRQDG
jgi:ABC-type transport system involved in multi-copper enzyme maturation permease subunit